MRERWGGGIGSFARSGAGNPGSRSWRRLSSVGAGVPINPTALAYASVCIEQVSTPRTE
jgi:hypothetical protein